MQSLLATFSLQKFARTHHPFLIFLLILVLLWLYAEIPKQIQRKWIAALILYILVWIDEDIIKFALFLCILRNGVQKITIVLFVSWLIVGNEIWSFALQNRVSEFVIGRRLFFVQFCTANHTGTWFSEVQFYTWYCEEQNVHKVSYEIGFIYDLFYRF